MRVARQAPCAVQRSCWLLLVSTRHSAFGEHEGAHCATRAGRQSAVPPPPPPTQGVFRISKTQEGGTPCPRPPPPQTKVTIVRKNDIYKRENLVGPFLGHKLWGTKPSPPLPPFPPLKRRPAPPPLREQPPGQNYSRCCFRNFRNRGVWGFHFRVVHDDRHGFGADLRLGMVFWGSWVLPCHPVSPPSCPLEVEIWGSPDDWYTHDAMVTSCAFSRRAQTPPLSEPQEASFPSNFGT